MSSSRATATPRRTATIAGFAVLLIGVVALTMAALAPGKAAEVLGKAGNNPDPQCPKDCSVVASVTGFQTTANGKRPQFKVPSDGHIVAWSVDLSRPTKGDRDLLQESFGAPEARISILKQQNKRDFKLTKHSPKVKLAKSLNREPTFTLKRPIKVKKGVVVGLTTSTWVSNFASGGELSPNGDKWRASRSRRKCGDDPNKSGKENRDDLLESKPHSKVGSSRSYGCTYGDSRILYKAYFVPARSGDGSGE